MIVIILIILIYQCRFSQGDGVCTRIPYSDAPIPTAAKVASWSVCELHGIVFVWYHAEKSAPQYELPLLDDVVSGKMIYHGSQSQGLVNMHVQDLAENSTDFAHFRCSLVDLTLLLLAPMYALLLPQRAALGAGDAGGAQLPQGGA